MAVSACSSDDDTASGGAGAAGKAGATGEAGEHSVGGGSTAGGGGSAGEAGTPGMDVAGSPGEGGAVGEGGAAGGGAVVASCLASGDLAVSALSTLKYVIDTQTDPDLTFCRGRTYNFVLDASTAGHPFYIKTVDNSTGTGDAYPEGVTGNGSTGTSTTPGQVAFTVHAGAPDTLYYHCSNHAGMGGKITIIDAP